MYGKSARRRSPAQSSAGCVETPSRGRSMHPVNCRSNHREIENIKDNGRSVKLPMAHIFNGRSLPIFLDKTNRKRTYNYSRYQQGKPLGYGTIDNMSDASQAQHQVPHDEGRDAFEPQSNSPIIPLELEATSTNQRHRGLLKSVRLYAFGLSVLAAIAVGVICLVGSDTPVSAHQQSIPSSSNGNGVRSNSSSTLPNVKKPKKLQDAVEDESVIRKLREEFHEWKHHHGRDYGSKAEKEKRFHIWKENHFRTQEKNERHGPCKLTGQAVFGSNHFKDLSPEEFQSQYLTGYTGPHTDNLGKDRRKLRSDQLNRPEDVLKSSSATTQRRAESEEVLSSNGLHDPSVDIKRHTSVQERYLKYMEDAPMLGKTYYNWSEKQNEKMCKCGSNYSNYSNRRILGFKTAPLFGKTYYNKSEKQQLCGYSKSYYSSSTVDCSKYKLEAGKDYKTSDEYKSEGSSCVWYNASCLLRNIFQPVYKSSSENYYSNYNYPSAIDWRQMGAVTSVHSQGSCGACWAITAVETIESANFISNGALLDLSESEVIICDTSCEMCNGGWPQNAYQYVMDNKGIPLEPGYDGDLLMTMTTVRDGSSDELTESEMEAIQDETCPDGASGSSDANGSSQATRYAAINSYAYATDRCVCYTDGSGCDCDEQNEALAVMNVASFGPATVCLEAGTWQDYTGGIITADSGCSSAFMDMNHCVQTVGYAFQEVDGDDENDENDNSNSNSNDSKDGGNKKLEGYWIIRNQWSSYWGMNGYAYVAMGSNTCGVLNDMTQVFFK